MTRLRVPFRLAAWVVIVVLVLLTIAPPSARPDSGVSHHLEHFASFFIAGALWYMGYPRRLLLCLTLAVLFASSLESLQLLVPGRHSRLVDFVADTLGAWSGSAAAFVILSVLAGLGVRCLVLSPMPVSYENKIARMDRSGVAERDDLV
jgi:VanZ family protein